MADLPRRPSHCEDDVRCTVEEQKVFVESFQFSEAHNVVVGTVRVWNIDPMKRLFTRYTLDNWETHIDLENIWEGSIGDEQWPQTDQFCFTIPLPSPKWGGHVQFAVKYEVAGQTFWDNNHGMNYKIAVRN